MGIGRMGVTSFCTLSESMGESMAYSNGEYGGEHGEYAPQMGD